jgi:hypothetical protein
MAEAKPEAEPPSGLLREEHKKGHGGPGGGSSGAEDYAP